MGLSVEARLLGLNLSGLRVVRILDGNLELLGEMLQLNLDSTLALDQGVHVLEAQILNALALGLDIGRGTRWFLGHRDGRAAWTRVGGNASARSRGTRAIFVASARLQTHDRRVASGKLSWFSERVSQTCPRLPNRHPHNNPKFVSGGASPGAPLRGAEDTRRASLDVRGSSRAR